MTTCAQCGAETIGRIRGRRRRYCSDRCRHAAHRRRRLGLNGSTPLRQTPGGPVPPAPGGLDAWAAWVRGAYVIDRTGEELLRLIVEADRRYCQARDVLDTTGLTWTSPNGRVQLRPEVAIERDTRAAIQRLIAALDLEEMTTDAEAIPTTDSASLHAQRRRLG